MIILVALLAITGSLLATPQENALDPHVIMEQVHRLAAASPWPGFNPLRTPVAFFTGRQTLLFGHPRPPGGFTPVVGREGVTVFPGRHESIVANTSVSLGGAPTATIMLESLSTKSTVEIAAVVIHEAFHVFQGAKHKDWSTNEALLFSYPMDEVKNQSGLALEARALVHALQAQTEAEAARWAVCHLQLRQKRYKSFPGAADYERGVELYEGTAHYAEAKVLGRTGDTASLALPWKPDQIRRRCYFTGKALADLLDRVKPDWIQGLETGLTNYLDVLLQESLASASVEPAQFEKEEIAEVAAAAERAVDALKKDREKAVLDFRGRAGIRMIIETRENNLLQLSGFDPMNILKIGEKDILHLRMLALSGKNGQIQILGLPSVSLGQGPHPLFSGIKRLEIAGFTGTPEITEREGKLTMNTDSLKMTLTKASLSRKGSTIRIILNSQ